MSKAIRKNIQKHLRAAVLGAFCGLSLGTMLIRPAFALPSGEHDMRNIDAVTRAGQNMDITGTGNAVIKWNDFSLNSGDVVKFSGMARMLNYVDGKYNPSLIDGTINATGINLYIINPSGVLFGDNSIVNAGHLFVSSRSLTNTDIDNFVTGGDPLSGTATLGGGLLSSNIVGAYDIADGDIMMLGKVAANSLTVEGNVIQIKNTKNITNPTKTALLQGDEVKLISDNPVEVGFEVPKWSELSEDEPGKIKNDLAQAKYGKDYNDTELDDTDRAYVDSIVDYLKSVTLTGTGETPTKEVPLYYYADKYGVWKDSGKNTSNFEFVMKHSGEKLGYNVNTLNGNPGMLQNYRLIKNAWDLQAMNKSAYMDFHEDVDGLNGYPNPEADADPYRYIPTKVSAGNYMLNDNIDLSGMSGANGFFPINMYKTYDQLVFYGNEQFFLADDEHVKIKHFLDGFNGLNHSISGYSLTYAPSVYVDPYPVPLFEKFYGTMKNLRFSTAESGTTENTGNLIGQVMPNYTGFVFDGGEGHYENLYGDAIRSYFKNIKLESPDNAVANEGMIRQIGTNSYFSVGVVELSNIENNITIRSTVEPQGDGQQAVGGLVGYHGLIGDGSGEGFSLKISNSINKKNVSTEYSGNGTGGLVGLGNENSPNGSQSGSPIRIEKSVNKGIVTATNWENAGGIIGFTHIPVDITSSYNSADVSSESGNAGGLVGYSYKVLNIDSSMNYGNVTGRYAGGLVGKASNMYDDTISTINDSYNMGDITATGYEEGAGGIAGGFYGDITNTYNTGDISAPDGYAGGIVGNLAGAVYKSYNKGGSVTTGEYGFAAHGIAGSHVNLDATNDNGIFASDASAYDVYINWNIDTDGTNPSAIWRVYDGEPLLTAFMRTVTVDPTITPVDAESELPSHVTGDGPYTMDVKDISQVDMAAADPYWTDVELTDKGRALANSRTAITTDKAGNSTQLSATGGGSDNVKLSSSQFGYNFQFKQGNSAVVASDYTAAGITDADKVNKVYLLVNGSPAPGTTPPGPTPPGPTPPVPTPGPTPRPNPPATESASPAVPDIELNLDEVGKQSKEMFKPQDYPFQKGMYYDLDKSTHQLTYGADVSSDSLADNVVSNEYDLAADGNMNDASVNSGKNTVISEAAPSDDGKKSTQSDEEQEEVN